MSRVGALFPTTHRPWPTPRAPWVMAQTWHDLLFAHWPIEVATMRAHVPRELELDTFDGAAWLGVVPFRMSGVRLRGMPGFPGVRAFPELNLRTYVSRGGRPGVWFFSLDAASPLAVAVARAWFHLPYFRARMNCAARGAEVEYECARVHPGSAEAVFRGTYGPAGPVELARRGTLEHWLTERYCLYARSPRGRVRRGEIHHAPWPLQPARARIDVESISRAQGFPTLSGAPHLLFARRIDVRIWAPARTDRES